MKDIFYFSLWKSLSSYVFFFIFWSKEETQYAIRSLIFYLSRVSKL